MDEIRENVDAGEEEEPDNGMEANGDVWVEKIIVSGNNILVKLDNGAEVNC